MARELKRVDPVCRKSTSCEKFRVVYKGLSFYFCSATCQAEFKRNPDHYTPGAKP